MWWMELNIYGAGAIQEKSKYMFKLSLVMEAW